MRIIAYIKIKEFITTHANSNIPLNEWYNKSEEADWHSLKDIKKTFNSVDYVGNKRYVFNIGGNNYRIVAMIFFEVGQVYIRFIGTHKDYEKIDCKNI